MLLFPLVWGLDCLRDEAWRVPEGKWPTSVKCPVILRNLIDDESWLNNIWDRLEGSQVVPFDVGSFFTYWDNSTLLASTTRARQSFERQYATQSQVIARVREGNARYGGSLRAFKDLDVSDFDKFRPDEGQPRPPALFLGSKNTVSAPHYDSFHNVHVVLAGTKSVQLSSPYKARSFDIYPTTHPSARQARLDLQNYRIQLHAADAVFVPAGWIHRFEVTEDAVALSLTTLPPEFLHFPQWVQSPESLPFVRDGTPIPDFAADLRFFVRSLADKLRLTHVLEDVVDRAYSPLTRAELGIPLPRYDDECPFSDKPKDRARVTAAADSVASVLRSTYRPWLRPLYFQPFLENVCSKVAARTTPPNVTREAFAIFSALSFIETCVLDRRRSVHNDEL